MVGEEGELDEVVVDGGGRAREEGGLAAASERAGDPRGERAQERPEYERGPLGRAERGLAGHRESRGGDD